MWDIMPYMLMLRARKCAIFMVLPQAWMAIGAGLLHRLEVHCRPCSWGGKLRLRTLCLQAMALASDDWTVSTLTVVVVGASGDLAKKKIFPALFALYYEGLLPDVSGRGRGSRLERSGCWGSSL